MKKEYKKPKIRIHTIKERINIVCMSSPNKGNNGNHYGWENPNNPHYEGDEN